MLGYEKPGRGEAPQSILMDKDGLLVVTGPIFIPEATLLYFYGKTCFIPYISLLRNTVRVQVQLVNRPAPVTCNYSPRGGFIASLGLSIGSDA